MKLEFLYSTRFFAINEYFSEEFRLFKFAQRIFARACNRVRRGKFSGMRKVKTDMPVFRYRRVRIFAKIC